MGKLTNFSPTFPMYPGDAASVTVSDTATFNPSVVYVGTAGNVKITTAQGSDITFTGVNAGTVIPVQAIRVWSTGTTASAIVRIF